MAGHPEIQILDNQAIHRKIDRLAIQIYEHNHEEKGLIVCGVQERGFQLAEMIHGRLSAISDLSPILISIQLDKKNPAIHNIFLEPKDIELHNKVVILCDDVLYTGKTLTYATIPFLQAGV